MVPAVYACGREPSPNSRAVNCPDYAILPKSNGTKSARLRFPTFLPEYAGMPDDIAMQKRQLDEIRGCRADLIEQIRLSQKTIERSHELIKRIDDLLARSR